eukprot:CAMPEP_0114313748 /NCGR_PEP_ID=MMETSP0059-20121206/21326_1 /TAXON_ID=36894 /ORGANISM="Pyramimonas parkeae, Strain CCMP726" /LENGTH=141 /DNA_ID=CAMNT_0001438615 /DNA_START=159 /DNA_END=585 /DNA_ORIENTATION=+
MPRLLPATSTCILNTRVVSQRYTGVPSSDRGTVGVELGKRLRSEMKTDKEYETEHTFMESAYTSCCDNVLVATDPHSLILHVNEQLEPYTPNRPIPHEDETALIAAPERHKEDAVQVGSHPGPAQKRVAGANRRKAHKLLD